MAYGQNNQKAPVAIHVNPSSMFGGCLDTTYKYASYEYVVTKGYPVAIYLVTADVYARATAQGAQDAALSITYDAANSCVMPPGRAISQCPIGIDRPNPVANTTTVPCFLVNNSVSNVPVESYIRLAFSEPIQRNGNGNGSSQPRPGASMAAPTPTAKASPNEQLVIGKPDFKTTSTKIRPSDLPTATMAATTADASSAHNKHAHLATSAAWCQRFMMSMLCLGGMLFSSMLDWM
ncbi:hypothetical protein SYNPS1DRAFT_27356 [Syncephalis pseudoplumigaleata]|uniref:Uncharacterized protein n=1 Tax=Syncephalis pseudoplumigaleata TaxID=1712513 RepID=A0A4P9Z3L2_9FUNG|nr:hypothetical protein SYNPS1DRAFT_27356 [Syncephalis pseudoplumigaleata]|eukprot:RKP26978.1 hypothetical protein SYNPS1DRAFT_27356 [Syncephalis pseudoplumigaleata]